MASKDRESLSKHDSVSHGSADADAPPPPLPAGLAGTASTSPEDKHLSASERHEQLLAWRKRVELGGPKSADWEEFEKLVGKAGERVERRQ